jgi:hypothetical protein
MKRAIEIIETLDREITWRVTNWGMIGELDEKLRPVAAERRGDVT